MSQTLNDKQQKLVEDNHNLIFKFLQSHNLSLDATDDWYGTAAIGLCKAAMRYDESRGAKFSTLAYVCMENEVRMVMRTNRKCVSDTVSIDEMLDNAEGLDFHEIIPDEDNFEEKLYLNDAVERAMRGMSDVQKQVITLVVDNGYTQAEAASIVGLSRSYVSKIYTTFIDRVRKYFND